MARLTKPNKRNVTRRRTEKKVEIDRPFAPGVWKEAVDIARRYRVMMSFEEAAYYGATIEFPLVMADGNTPGICYANTIEATTAAVATMIEKGEDPPDPVSGDSRRTEQVNIRLTKLEKLRLEELARQKGFRGVSDYVRSRALEG